MTLPKDLQIKCDYKGRTLGIFGPLNKATNIFGVAHSIQLEPKRLCRCSGHVFDRIYRHGAEGIGDAKGFGGAGCFYLTICVLHTGQANRR